MAKYRLVLLALLGCASPPPMTVPSAPDVIFHSVRFFFEKPGGERVGAVRLDPFTGVVLLDGEPLVRRPGPGVFEVDGRPYHFKKDSQVFVFAPRPGGEFTLIFKELPLTLVGRSEDRFVVEQREEGNRVTLKYELAEISYEAGRYVGPDGEELSPVERRQGLRVTRWGKTKLR